MTTYEERQFGGSREEYSCWIPVGLIAAGTVGALVALTQAGRSRGRHRWNAEPDSGELTPPHGDKLLARERW